MFPEHDDLTGGRRRHDLIAGAVPLDVGGDKDHSFILLQCAMGQSRSVLVGGDGAALRGGCRGGGGDGYGDGGVEGFAGGANGLRFPRSHGGVCVCV